MECRQPLYALRQASLCVQNFQKSEMQQSHVAPKEEARRSRVEERSAGIEKSLLTHTNTNFRYREPSRRCEA